MANRPQQGGNAPVLSRNILLSHRFGAAGC